MLAVKLGDPAHLGSEEVLEVGLCPVAGDVYGGQQHGQPVLDLVVHCSAQPLALAAHLQDSVQERDALYEVNSNENGQ